jgi:hypothetical protein
MTAHFEVILESESTEADRGAVRAVFESAGIPADVQRVYARRSAEQLPWLIEIYAPVGIFLSAAAASAGTEAGKDGWKALKQLVKRLYEARRASRAPQGGVDLKDPDTGPEIRLPPHLPDLAYRRLYEIENPHAPLSGILIWDGEAQAWTDALAGKLPCQYPGCAARATQARVHRASTTVVERHHFCDAHAAAADTGDPQA